MEQTLNIKRATLSAVVPLSLYIHLPWCAKKCPYCDFNSHTLRNELPEEEYVEALIQDASEALPLVWGRRIETIFIGGGTPSLFSAKALDSLISKLRALFNFAPNIEITIEANPHSAEFSKFRDYQALGINRISIGVQSFNKIYLERLGRLHTPDEAFAAIAAAKELGIKFNTDIMWALPEQSKNDALKDLQTAIDLKPEHISWYQLTIEPNTAFANKPPVLPASSVADDIYDNGITMLETAGFKQYEVSAFGRTHQCAHNMNYWQFGDYLGIGAGAHSKLTVVSENQIKRIIKKPHPKAYLADSDKILSTEIVTEERRVFEFCLNALRLKNGFSLQLFTERTGLSQNVLLKKLDTFISNDCFVLTDGKLVPTKRGFNFIDTILLKVME